MPAHSRSPWVHSLVAMVALAALPAAARPLVRTAANPPSRRTVTHRVAPPPPPVPLQLGGLRPGVGRPWAAAAHAIHRDAFPSLTVCANRLADSRGVVHVELSHRESRRWVATVASARHDHALEACVQRAVDRIVLPPSEDFDPTAELPSATDNHSHVPPRIGPIDTEAPVTVDAPEDLVAFDLLFGMPSPAPRRP